jgi:hypothetical protein
MIGATGLQLGRGKIENALTGTLGHLVNEAQQVLVGVTEA